MNKDDTYLLCKSSLVPLRTPVLYITDPLKSKRETDMLTRFNLC